MEFLRGSGCHLNDADAIALALQEGLANAVVHGCHNDRRKTILCSAGCDRGGGVLIVIRDPGSGFDPTRVSNPLTPNGMANDHGRGIHLMHSIMDEVRFEENGTCLILRKY